MKALVTRPLRPSFSAVVSVAVWHVLRQVEDLFLALLKMIVWVGMFRERRTRRWRSR